MKNPVAYPRMCPACCANVHAATIHHVSKIRYEGRTHDVEIPNLRVGKCLCGEVVFDLDTDRQIDMAFRCQVGLLTAEQIRDGRKRLRLKQAELARAIGVAKATISRWETRTLVQSKAMDKALRAFFHDPHVRALMRLIENDSSIGTGIGGDESHRPGCSTTSPHDAPAAPIKPNR